MPRWDDPGSVAFFRDRPPDHRLVALVEAGALACGLRVLDLGCAGGRNAAYLTRLDVEVVAVDAEPAMVETTRARLTAHLGAAEASRRARVGRFDRLDFLPDGGIDLVLALGVLQNATSDAEFERGVAEIARVLRPGGDALVAHFSPASRPPEGALRLVAAGRHAYLGFFGDDPERPMVLHEAADLDAAFADAGFAPLVATETVVAPSAGAGSHREAAAGREGGTRVTINAHYRRRG